LLKQQSYLESMDASSFICTLRRFFALHGPTSPLRCDRGTNSITAKGELGGALGEMDQHKVEKYVQPAIHLTLIRSMLDDMFVEVRCTKLTHKLLVTAEVTAIVNAYPTNSTPTDVDEL